MAFTLQTHLKLGGECTLNYKKQHDIEPLVLHPWDSYAQLLLNIPKESKIEAKRDGVPPIELIDGDAIVELFEKYSLGLKPRMIYDVVPDFFENFR